MPLILDETDSTNTYAKEHFDELADGTLVVARHQTAGRGRLGRRWLTSPGSCITATAVFKNVRNGFHAGCIVGMSALKLVREAVPESDPFLKWPNDIYLGEKKLAGLLGEGIIKGGELSGVVMGIGLNVNLSAEELARIDQPAISLKMAGGNDFNVENLAKRLEKLILEYYIIYPDSFWSIFSDWRASNRLIGRRLTVVDPAGKSHVGIFCDVKASGEMIFEENGILHEFSCGDVRIDKSTMKMANNP